MEIQSRRLTVQIAEPGTVYAGPRFDWTGFITQVTLDGTHRFCVPESLVPGKGTGGIGLCSEFGIAAAIGFDETSPGQSFPKLGIGLLTRYDDRPYSFWNPYPIEPFPCEITSTGDRASFRSLPLPCRGREALLLKQVSVDECTLRVEYRLENVGTLPIETEEYNHNFLGFAAEPTGPGFRLGLPFDTSGAEAAHPLQLDSRGLTWTATPQEPFQIRFNQTPEGETPCWKLRHEASGLSVCETLSAPWTRLNLYGTEHSICPETFFPISIAPGQIVEWSRTWRFSSED